MFEPNLHHSVVSLSKNINPSSVLFQPRKTRPFIIGRVLMICKEYYQTNKQTILLSLLGVHMKFCSVQSTDV